MAFELPAGLTVLPNAQLSDRREGTGGAQTAQGGWLGRGEEGQQEPFLTEWLPPTKHYLPGT